MHVVGSMPHNCSRQYPVLGGTQQNIPFELVILNCTEGTAHLRCTGCPLMIQQLRPPPYRLWHRILQVFAPSLLRRSPDAADGLHLLHLQYATQLEALMLMLMLHRVSRCRDICSVATGAFASRKKLLLFQLCTAADSMMRKSGHHADAGRCN